MAGLFVSSSGAQRPTAASGMTIQSSCQGLPVPIVYGLTKMSANLIGYYDFKATEQKQGKKGKGGKSSVVGYTYSACVLMGLCEGAVAGIGRVWTAGGETTASDLGFTKFYGTDDQEAWGYMTSKHSGEALNYKGIAYVAASELDLGPIPALPQLWFEVGKEFDRWTDTAYPSTAYWESWVGRSPWLDENDEADVSTVTAEDGVGVHCTLDYRPASYYLHTHFTGSGLRPDLPTGDIGDFIVVIGFHSSAAQTIGSHCGLRVQDTPPTFYDGVQHQVFLQTAQTVSTQELTYEFPSGVVSGQDMLDGRVYLETVFYKVNAADPNVTVYVDYVKIIDNTFASSGGGEVYPNVVIRDFLTNERYGLRPSSGFPLDTASLDTAPDSLYRYCAAQDILFSMAITTQSPARDYLARWLDTINVAPVWSGGVLKFKPYGDSEIVGEVTTYTPDNTAVYDLTDDDFYVDPDSDDDPIEWSVPDTYDCNNVFAMNVLDKDNAYNQSTVEAKDQASIEEIGLRPAGVVDATFLSTPERGRLCVEMMKNRKLYVRARCKFRLPWNFTLLEPMDIVTLPHEGTGLSAVPVRILSVEEDDAGILSIESEEYLADVQRAPQYNAQGNEATPITNYVTPTPVQDVIIFESPSALKRDISAKLYLLASGIHDTWGGCVVWASLDGGTSYLQIGIISGGSTIGRLTAALGSYTGNNPDETNTLSVNTNGTGEFTSYSEDDALNNVSLCVLQRADATFELLTYEDSTLTATDQYDITTINRGLYITDAASAAIDDRLALVNRAIQYVLPETVAAGDELFFKFQSFNPVGSVIQDLSECEVYPYTVTLWGTKVPGTMVFNQLGTMTDGQVIFEQTALFDYEIPDGFVGTIVTGFKTPTETAVLSVQKNGVEIGTITIGTDRSVTMYGGGTFAPNDVLTVLGPDPADETLANVLVKLAYNRLTYAESGILQSWVTAPVADVETRVTEDGDTRMTESGDTRIIE